MDASKVIREPGVMPPVEAPHELAADGAQHAPSELDQDASVAEVRSEGAAAQPEKKKFQFDWAAIRESPAFWPGLILLAAFGVAFWPLFLSCYNLWQAEDGYYSHGFLVPLISGYVVYRWWPRLSQIKAKPAYEAIIPLLAVLWVGVAACINRIDSAMAVSFIAAVSFGTAFIAGWRWMFALALPTLYLAFCMPLWNMAITVYTNPLQVMSTKVAYKMLDIAGFQPLRDDSIIYLNNFTLDVGVPCSGLKLVLALCAFTFFFAFIANLRWWGNAILIALILPLALFINGLRIMLIGVVGNTYGSDAGHKFHDYSGYVTLIVCFFILFKIARWLGWKD